MGNELTPNLEGFARVELDGDAGLVGEGHSGGHNHIPSHLERTSNADHVLSSEMVPEADVPAYTGEMEMKARSRNRAMIVRRSEPMKLSVLPI